MVVRLESLNIFHDCTVIGHSNYDSLLILIEPMRKIVLPLSITIVMCAYVSGNSEIRQACLDLPFQYSGYSFKIWPISVSISNATELANREGSSLLVIEHQQTEQRILAQMSLCLIRQVWLGIQQVSSDRLLTDSGPWSWISDCDKQEDAVISFQGCYIENNNDRDLSVDSGLTSDDVTGDKCIEQCRRLGQKYAGIHQPLTGEYRCYCGQSYGKHGAVPGCSYTCPEGTSHSCGGIGRNSVYHTSNKTLWGNWFENYPDFDQTHPYCAYISRNRDHNNNYFLKNHKCDEKLPFICTSLANDIGIDIATACASHQGFGNESLHEGLCYYISSDTKVWHKAKYACSEFNGELVVVKNESKHYFLKQMLLSIPGDQYKDIWVGVSRETFRRLDNNGTLCYTKFNEKIKRRHRNVYIEQEGGQTMWKLTDDTEESSISLATAITQYPLRTTEPPTQRPTDRSTELPPDRVTEMPTQRTTDQLTDRPTEQPTEQPAERSTQQVTEPIDLTESVEITEEFIPGESTVQPSNTETVTPDKQENKDEEGGLSAGITAAIIVLSLLLVSAVFGAFVLFCKNQNAVSKPVRRATKSRVSKQIRKKRNEEAWSTSESGDTRSASNSGETKSVNYTGEKNASVEKSHLSESTSSNSEMPEAKILNMLPNLKKLSEKMNSRDKNSQENMQNASPNSDPPDTNLFVILSTVGKMSGKAKSKTEILQDANQKWHVKTSIESDFIISDSNTTESSISGDTKQFEEPKRRNSSVDKLPKFLGKKK